MKRNKILLISTIVVLVAIFFSFDLGEYFTLDFFKSKQTLIESHFIANPVKTGLIYLCIYIIVTGLSLPGAAIMTLTGGAIFGLIWGSILVSFASSIGATIAFMASRFLFQNAIQERFSGNLKAINDGMGKDGAFYLFTLRLVPIFPYFIINLVMGLTPIRTFTFYFITQLGMLPATIVFVNAGTQIAKIKQASDILSPELIASFVLLGIFPLLAKKLLAFIKTRKTQTPIESNNNEQI